MFKININNLMLLNTFFILFKVSSNVWGGISRRLLIIIIKFHEILNIWKSSLENFII